MLACGWDLSISAAREGRIMNQESEILEFFGPLLADPSKIKREAVHRRKQFDEKSILAEEIPAYEAGTLAAVACRQ